MQIYVFLPQSTLACVPPLYRLALANYFVSYVKFIFSITMAKRPAVPSARQNGSSSVKKARVEAPSKANAKPAGILKKPPPASSKGKVAPAVNGSAAKGKGKAVATKFDESTVIENPPAASSGLAEISKYTSSKKSIPTSFELVAGSYERILYGLHCAASHAGEAAAVEVEMQPIFQFPAHLTCVKTAAASPNGRWLVTGAADEVIKVWDLRRRKEVGGLLGHEGQLVEDIAA